MHKTLQMWLELIIRNEFLRGAQKIDPREIFLERNPILGQNEKNVLFSGKSKIAIQLLKSLRINFHFSQAKSYSQKVCMGLFPRTKNIFQLKMTY